MEIRIMIKEMETEIGVDFNYNFTNFKINLFLDK